MNRTKIEEIIQQKKAFLTSEYSVNRIGLFGSYSRDEQTKKSDIDILVEFSRPLGFKFFTLKLYLESLFDRPVDLVTIKGLKPRYKDVILQEVRYQ